MAPSGVVFCLSDVLLLLTVNDLTPGGVFLRSVRDACCTLLPYIVFLARVLCFGSFGVLGMRSLCVRTFGGFVTYILSL